MYVTSTTLPVRIRSAKHGFITGWVLSRDVTVPPLQDGDKLSVATIACNNSVIESDVEPVKPPLDERELYVLSQNLQLSARPDVVAELVAGQTTPVYMLKGPRGHHTVLTGNENELRRWAIPDRNGFAVFPLTRPLQQGVLHLHWFPCEHDVVTKGNPTSEVHALKLPLKPVIEQPQQQSKAPLGVYPIVARDPGELTAARALTMHLKAGRLGANVAEAQATGHGIQGTLNIADYSQQHVVEVWSRNELGDSPHAQVTLASKEPPPPPQRVTGKIDARFTGELGVRQTATCVVRVDGQGFVGEGNASVVALFGVMGIDDYGQVVRNITQATVIPSIAVDNNGRFSGSGEVTVWVYDYPYPNPVNDGLTLVVTVGNRLFKNAVTFNTSRDL